MNAHSTYPFPPGWHKNFNDLSAQGWLKREATAYIHQLRSQNAALATVAAEVPQLRHEVEALKSSVRRRDAELNDMKRELGILARAVVNSAMVPAVVVPKAHKLLTTEASAQGSCAWSTNNWPIRTPKVKGSVRTEV